MASNAALLPNPVESEPLPLPITHPSAVQEQAKQPHELLGLMLVALSAVCFSWMSTFVKYETDYTSSMEAVFWRSSISWCINYVVLWYTGRSVYVKPEERRAMFFRCFVGFTSIAFSFYAVSKMVLADASVIVLTSPFFTFFFGAWVLGEAIDTFGVVCAFTSISGLIFVVRPGFIFGYTDGQPTGSWDAYVAGILGAIFQALVYIAVRQLKHFHYLVILHYFMLFSSIVSAIYIAAVERHFVIPKTATLWLAVIGTGVFTFLGQCLFTRGFQLEKAGVAAVMRYLEIVFVFIWDASFLGEQVSYWSIVGAVIICVSASLIALRKAKIV